MNNRTSTSRTRVAWRPTLTRWALALTLPVAGLAAADNPPLPVTKDKVQSVVGILRGGSLFSPDGEGHTGRAGDYAIDVGRGTGPVHVPDAAFLNQAAADDAMSLTL